MDGIQGEYQFHHLTANIESEIPRASKAIFHFIILSIEHTVAYE